MKTTILSISAAIVLTSVAVACTSPAPTGPASTDSDLSNNDPSTPAPKASASASASTSATAPAAASSTAPAPSTSATTGTGDPSEAQYKQCMTQCAGTNQQAIQIFNTDMACSDKCAQDDDNCFESCFEKSQCSTDQSVSAACDALDSCDQKCEPADTSSPQGGQGNQQF